LTLKPNHVVADAELIAQDFWEQLAQQHEHKDWDEWYSSELVGCVEYWDAKAGMPCPECGTGLHAFFGQIDQDRMGNDIHGAGFICHTCGFEDIQIVD